MSWADGRPRQVEEVPAGDELGLPAEAFRAHPDWAGDHPWLLQGTTTAAALEGGPLDLRLFGAEASPEGLSRWEAVRVGVGMVRATVGSQVHGARVRTHQDGSPGVLVVDATDAHVTREPGILLGVTLADCVPLFLVAPDARIVALVHAGWRGIVEGVVEETLATLRDRFGASPEHLRAHLGPAVCGRCYEVGPEVHGALGHDPPEGPAPVDLRLEAAARLAWAGVGTDAVTVSSHCTKCGDVPFFSHRRGDTGRHAALLGVRWEPGP